MKVRGLKEVKKGAKLLKKKEKIEKAIEKLRNQYHSATHISNVDGYFDVAIKSYAENHLNKNN